MRVMQTSRRSTKRGIRNSTKETTGKRARKSKNSTENQEIAQYDGEGSGNEPRVHINQFPPHVLGLIFSKLVPVERLRIEKVCRHWRQVAIIHSWDGQASISYEELLECYYARHQQITNRHVTVILKRTRHHLRVLDLNGFRHEQVNYSICTSMQHVPRLHTLKLENLQLTNSSLLQIGSYLPDLKHASFRNSFKNTNMEKGLSQLFSHCSSLESLNVSENEMLQGACFSALPKSLQTLNISSCFRLKPIALVGIQENCANLQTLIMDQVDTVQTHQLNSIFAALKNLTVLHFSECYGSEFYEGQPSLTALGNLALLRELHICDNLLINNDVLNAIGHGCRSLELLNLSMSNRAVTDTGLRHIANLKALTELRLTGHRALTDDTLNEITKKGVLKVLGLGRCSNISNQSVILAIRMCKQLNSLDVSYCPSVTQVIFKELDKQLFIRNGRSTTPSGGNGAKNEEKCRKFQLSISRSGIHGCVPQKYSPWIKIVDHYDTGPLHTSPAMLVAHFLHLPHAFL